jgi:hypothetical protein
VKEKTEMPGKYYPLERHLSARATNNEISLSFKEIEGIIGAPLPDSAFKYPAWWANQLSEGHTQKDAWMNAGFRVKEVDQRREGGSVVFQRV